MARKFIERYQGFPIYQDEDGFHVPANDIADGTETLEGAKHAIDEFNRSYEEANPSR